MFKKGDWIAEIDTSQPLLGVVKDCYLIDNNQYCVDIIVFDWNGRKIGRRSPAEGGPTNFEPACPAEYFKQIKKPDFPLKRGLCGEYDHSLICLH